MTPGMVPILHPQLMTNSDRVAFVIAILVLAALSTILRRWIK
jgi:hypothetical protein